MAEITYLQTAYGALQLASRFTQQKPCNQGVKSLKVAVIVGSAIATVATPLGPCSIILRPLIQTVAVRVAVIGGNLLCVSAKTLISGESFTTQISELMERQEDQPASVEIATSIAADYVWSVLKPVVVPDGTGEYLIFFIKEGVKVPTKVLADGLGSSLYHLDMSRLCFNPVQWSVIKKIFEEGILKCSTEKGTEACSGNFEMSDLAIAGTTVGLAVVFYNICSLVKKVLPGNAQPQGGAA